MAVSVGHLLYAVQWETSTTYITLGLNGDNYEISLIAAYDSRKLKNWADKIKSEKNKSNF